MTSNLNNDLFSSVISDIKSYSGSDPLLSWLRGVRRLRDNLPPKVLKAKLPRFLQKCVQSFEADPRYRNDVRYIQIWLQLMDYVENPRAILRTMESKGIGTKLSLFYQAYALYYEKLKKFDEADKMYKLGAQNLAEPMDKLQKSYGQFLQRIGRHKNKSIQIKERKTERRPLSERSFSNPTNACTKNSANSHATPAEEISAEFPNGVGSEKTAKEHCTDELDGERCSGNRSHDVLPGNLFADKQSMRGNKAKVAASTHGPRMLPQTHDTVVMKFIATATFDKPEAELNCHHGLVEPTVNTNEAMDVINGMFQEPLEPALLHRKHIRSCSEVGPSLRNELQILTDEDIAVEVKLAGERDENRVSAELTGAKLAKPFQEPLTIFIDGKESDEAKVNSDNKDVLELSESQESLEGSPSTAQIADAFVFPRPNDHSSESKSIKSMEKMSKTKFHEDTVVCRFVGTAISDEPKVENICHHGLLEPTVNLKEAMEDINNMFGKPIDFVRPGRKKKEKAAPSGRSHPQVFSILCDDDFVDQQVDPLPCSSSVWSGQDMFEPTVCMKEAMDEINKMFSIPMAL